MNFVASLSVRAAVVGTVIILGMNYAQRRWIRPLETRHAEGVKKLAEVRERFRNAKWELIEINDREQEARRLHQSLSSLHVNVPAEPAIVWLPTRIKTTLSESGIAQANVQLNKAVAEPALPGFERTYWHVTLPEEAEVRKLRDAMMAIAQIEFRDSYVNILDLSLHVDAGGTGLTTGYVNLTAFAPK